MSFSVPGYLYIMFNDCYEYYGNHFYKLGRTHNPVQRMTGYRTPFLDKSQYLYISERRFDNSIVAEYIMFCILKKYKVHPKREFIVHELDKIIEVIQILESMSSEDILKLYKTLKDTTFTAYYIKQFFKELPSITENVYEDLDEFFDKFKFRPKHPETYYKFGYREDKNELKLKELDKKLQSLNVL